MRSLSSVWRGIKAMRFLHCEPLPRWTIRKLGKPEGGRQFWAHWWTPIWHKGRGPYISIGLGVVAIYRGY